MTSAAPSSGFPRLEKYELLEEIGHGGMATVYRARDPRLGREVAVKVIHKHLRENAEVGARFLAEARAAAKLRHPGIVEVYDVSDEGDAERYLVVELLRGTTLRKVLQQHRDMPAEVGAAIVRELCDALEHAHEAAIVHRDIKPENVLVELPQDRQAASSKPDGGAPAADRGSDEPRVARASGERPRDDDDGGVSDTKMSVGGGGEEGTGPRRRDDPDVIVAGAKGARKARAERPAPKAAKPADLGVIIKITDFGIAKLLDAQGVTSTGQVLGSPAHMAPEQIEGGDVDARTDVFALGVLMYECLVGHLPFEGKNPAQVLRKVLEGQFLPADRERPTVGGRWARIVAGALAREPAQRTASPGQLGDQIEAELAALGVTDLRAEIAAYFADPSGYRARHTARLVPRLVSRGEKARKGGDIPGAAADFNRALALAPNDLAILKRVGSLTSSANRRHLMRRILTIAAGSAVLGLVTFQVTRMIRRGREVHPPLVGSSEVTTAAPSGAPTAAIAPSALASAEPSATASAAPVITADPMARRFKIPPGVTTALAPPTSVPASPGLRKVRFNVVPKGAKLAVDGQPLSWFLDRPRLAPGPHVVQATVDSRCCKRLDGTVTVTPPPADRPDEEQIIQIRMEVLPATVTLADAPPNGQLSCPSINLSIFAGSSKQVKLSDPDMGKVQCSFVSDKGTHVGSIQLRPGEVVSVPWPQD
jgi:serine/threonine protein kinase